MLVTFLASSAFAGGPPWLSVEMPGDPTNQSSHGAVLLLHAYSCGQPFAATVTGTAEGLVAGDRRTIPLTLEPTGETGVYAVKKQWPSEGTWVLAFTMDERGKVSTVVTLGPNGGVEMTEGRLPAEATVRAASIQVVPRIVTSTDVDKVLRAAASGEPPRLTAAVSTGAVGYLAGGLLAVAVTAGAVVGLVFGRHRRSTERS
jgi:hypothetical protein